MLVYTTRVLYTLYHPGYTILHTAHGLVYTTYYPLLWLPDDEALGSTREKAMGMRRRVPSVLPKV